VIFETEDVAEDGKKAEKKETDEEESMTQEPCSEDLNNTINNSAEVVKDRFVFNWNRKPTN